MQYYGEITQHDHVYAWLPPRDVNLMTPDISSHILMIPVLRVRNFLFSAARSQQVFLGSNLSHPSMDQVHLQKTNQKTLFFESDDFIPAPQLEI